LPKPGTGKIKWFDSQKKDDYIKLIESNETSLITENYDKDAKGFSAKVPRVYEFQRKQSDPDNNIITNNLSFASPLNMGDKYRSVSLAGIKEEDFSTNNKVAEN